MFFQWKDDALILYCTIQPKSNEERVVGTIGDALKIRLTAAPTDGKANKQLIRFLARQFQVKQSAITIVSGLTSRQKTVSIEQPNYIPSYIVCEQEAQEKRPDP